MQLHAVSASELFTTDAAGKLVLIGSKSFVFVQFRVGVKVQVALVAVVVLGRMLLVGLHLLLSVERSDAILV